MATRQAAVRGGLRDVNPAILPMALLAAAITLDLLGDTVSITGGLACFLVGLLHGAADEQHDGLHRFAWTTGAAYLVAAVATVALFLVHPLGALTIFLAMSAWHFARNAPPASLSYALPVALVTVGGSALWQTQTTSTIFALLLDQPIPEYWLAVLAIAGGAGTAGLLAAVARRRCAWPVPVLLTVAMMVLHPVLATGIAFLTCHALPVQTAQIHRYGIRPFISAVGPTAVLATIGIAIIGYCVISGWLPLHFAAALAFGMATPHMLTERL